jgi:hypothetical protein
MKSDRHLRLLPPRRSRRAIAVAAAAALNACYDYIAPPGGSPVANTEVRASLTDAGSVRMAPLVGGRVEAVDGRVERADADSLVLYVTRTTLSDGSESGWRGERVGIPVAAIATVRERQLDRPRTILAAVAGTGLVVAIWLSQHPGRSPAPPVVVGPPPPGQ